MLCAALRVRRRRAAVAVVAVVATAAALFVLARPHSTHLERSLGQEQEQAHSSDEISSKLLPIPCHINSQVLQNVGLRDIGSKVNLVACKWDKKGQEVYIPFSFIKQYFDVYGELKSTGNSSVFHWSHSYSKVFSKLRDAKYETEGAFMQFSSFEVENRARVKCVSAENGVPVTTQWSKEGYFYPTQICQYALAHWSKRLLESNEIRTVTVLEDGADHQADWIGDTTRVLKDNNCVHFDQASPISIRGIRNSHELMLSWVMQCKENASMSVTIRSSKLSYILRYVPDKYFVRKDGNVISFGYGLKPASNREERRWKAFTRQLLNDLQKGLSKKAFDIFRQQKPIYVDSLELSGVGCVTNISLASSDHLRQFFDAARWLVDKQDDMGGWPVDVVFNQYRAKYPQAEEISPGWHSAMAQGHALSVLTRAYAESKDKKYLETAVKALRLFRVPSEEGGFLAKFVGALVWYEEYPTNPSSFILNGFMYSLLGLHDLRETLSRLKEFEDEFREAEELFRDGMTSLQRMLLLFDTGTSSLYDLRHFSMHVEPKVARWDYHSTHINLLLTLSTADVEASILLSETAERWIGYMYGKRSSHN